MKNVVVVRTVNQFNIETSKMEQTEKSDYKAFDTAGEAKEYLMNIWWKAYQHGFQLHALEGEFNFLVEKNEAVSFQFELERR